MKTTVTRLTGIIAMLIALCATTISFNSCSQADTPVYPEIQMTEIIPEIAYNWNNQISYSGCSLMEIEVKSNIPVISARTWNRYCCYGALNFAGERGNKFLFKELFPTAQTKNDPHFETHDSYFTLIQSSSDDPQMGYRNYGFIETLLCFRRYGTRTRILSPVHEVSWQNYYPMDTVNVDHGHCYYFYGVIESFGRPYESSEKYMASGYYKGQYDNDGLCKTVIIPVNLTCDGCKYTMNVTCRVRDDEYDRFTERVSVGDCLETYISPGTFHDETFDDVRISQIRVCQPPHDFRE